MAEPNYRLDTWSGLDHYVCLVPGTGGWLHGWNCLSLTTMGAHLREAHGLTPVLEEEEEE